MRNLLTMALAILGLGLITAGPIVAQSATEQNITLAAGSNAAGARDWGSVLRGLNGGGAVVQVACDRNAELSCGDTYNSCLEETGNDEVYCNMVVFQCICNSGCGVATECAAEGS